MTDLETLQSVVARWDARREVSSPVVESTRLPLPVSRAAESRSLAAVLLAAGVVALALVAMVCL